MNLPGWAFIWLRNAKLNSNGSRFLTLESKETCMLAHIDMSLHAYTCIHIHKLMHARMHARILHTYIYTN